MRQSGILMHITSLPGPDGIGSLGKEAYEFADFLHEAGMGIWQVLPMGPTGYGESPYQSPSTFAGNPMVISLDKLAEEGYLDLEGEERYVPENPEQVDYAAAQENKMRLLRKAFAQSERKLKKQIAQFREENDWVYDFALFTAIKNHFDRQMWTKWPDEGARMRDPETLQKYEKKLDKEIRFHLWCQYIFSKQWFALKEYVNGLGIKLFGDIPIYVAEDSADTWTKPEVFQLDENTVGLSARSTGELNVQVIMEFFGGGGHQNVAGAQVKNSSLDEILERVVDVSQDYIKEYDSNESNTESGRKETGQKG